MVKKKKKVSPLKYLSNFWRTLEMLYINCEVSLDLFGSKNFVISAPTEKKKFEVVDFVTYVPVVTLPTEDDIKLLTQLESGFKKKINWNKYRSKDVNKDQNRYFNYLIELSFQGVNIFFILLFENSTDGKVHRNYYIPKTEIKDCNVIIDERDFVDQLIKK